MTGIESENLEQLGLLNIMPLAMFLQVNELFLLSELLHGKSDNIDLSSMAEFQRPNQENPNLKKTRSEKAARVEFTFRTCRLVKSINHEIGFLKKPGLKRRI